SIGIDTGSVVDSVKELMERIHHLHEELDVPILIEEYIEGREIYAAILGNRPPEALPLVELDLSKLPADTPKIAGWEVKFDRDSAEQNRRRSAPAREQGEDILPEHHSAATAPDGPPQRGRRGRSTTSARLWTHRHADGERSNPWLSSQAEFAMAARGSERT